LRHSAQIAGEKADEFGVNRHSAIIME
jgi:hypothetical protein